MNMRTFLNEIYDLNNYQIVDGIKVCKRLEMLRNQKFQHRF